MPLSDIQKLLGQAVDALSDDYPPEINLTIQQKLNQANIYFLYLTLDYDKDLTDEIYSKEVSELYIQIKTAVEDLEVDQSDPQYPASIIGENEARSIESKINELYELITSQLKIVDSLDDSYYQQ